jgi:tRNA(Ile)-lysidine synthetase-like protein
MRAVTDRIVLAHVVHDMRPAAEAHTDRDAVRALAELLGVPFVEAEVSVRHAPADAGSEHAKHLGANIEQVARVRRYDALARLALDAGIHFVATAHHAQDQLETLLMRLMRGAGPQGMRGIAPRRPLHPASPAPSSTVNADESAVWLIRPMLGVSRADTERLCRESDWTWRDDATNLDATRVRAAVRHRVIPALLAISPSADLHAAHTSGMLREIADLAFAAARRLDRRQPSPTSTQSHTRPGTDRLSYSLMQHLTDAIKDDSPDPRRFTLRGIQIEVTSREVHIRLTPLHAAAPHPTLAVHVNPADSSALSAPSTP